MVECLPSILETLGLIPELQSKQILQNTEKFYFYKSFINQSNVII